MVYFKVLLNDKRPKADNTYPVVIRVTHNRNNTTFNTGIRVKDNLWDELSSKVKHSHPNAQVYNKTITDYYSKVQNIAYQLVNSGEFNFESLKERLNEGIKPIILLSKNTFKEFADQLITDMFISAFLLSPM